MKIIALGLGAHGGEEIGVGFGDPVDFAALVGSEGGESVFEIDFIHDAAFDVFAIPIVIAGDESDTAFEGPFGHAVWAVGDEIWGEGEMGVVAGDAGDFINGGEVAHGGLVHGEEAGKRGECGEEGDGIDEGDAEGLGIEGLFADGVEVGKSGGGVAVLAGDDVLGEGVGIFAGAFDVEVEVGIFAGGFQEAAPGEEEVGGFDGFAVGPARLLRMWKVQTVLVASTSARSATPRMGLRVMGSRA